MDMLKWTLMGQKKSPFLPNTKQQLLPDLKYSCRVVNNPIKFATTVVLLSHTK